MNPIYKTRASAMKMKLYLTVWTVLIGCLFTTSVQAATYYFHNDHLGTPQVLTDTIQSVVWQADYDPFGKATETVATVEQNLRFPGQYFDRESGLHYNYFRTYDPAIGRYTQSEPIGLGGGVNTYGYAYQNALRYTDPTGEFVPLAWWAAGALWTAFEVAGSAYDLYGTVATFADECSSTTEKVVAGGLFAAGIVLPGAGLSSFNRVTKGAGKVASPSTLHTRGTKVPGGRKIEDTLAGSNKIENSQGDIFKRVDFAPSKPHAGLSPHTHPNFRNTLPDGTVRSGVSGHAQPVVRQDIIDAAREGGRRTGGL